MGYILRQDFPSYHDILIPPLPEQEKSVQLRGANYCTLVDLVRLFFTLMKYLTLARGVIGPSPFHNSL